MDDKQNKDLEKLRHFLHHKEVPLDVEETYAAFQKETHDGSRDQYLSYLRTNEYIDEKTFTEAHAASGLEVTGDAGNSSFIESIRYDLYDIIAEGAMGEIVLGRDRDLRRKVAIKVLKHEHMSTPVMKRFISEAQVTAQLDHPNIIPVYSLEIDPDGNVSFAMKLIQGKTLQDVIHEMLDHLEFDGVKAFSSRHPLADRLDILLRICDAISYAHSRGVIHRDLKPANIMLGEFGEVYVMDWGIARLVEKPEEGETLWEESGGEGFEAHHVERTQAGNIVGTPRYMSPEQAGGRSALLDERSDLYVIGLILYELVTLKKALAGDCIDEVLKNAEAGNVQPITHRSHGLVITAAMKAIIKKATAKDPDQRYRRVSELAEDLRRFVRGQEVSALPENTLQHSFRFMAKHRMVSLLSMVTLIAMFALATSWSLYHQKTVLEQSRVRESRFIRFQSETDIRAHEIDTQFLRFENILTLLADTFAWQISHGNDSDDSILDYRQLKPSASDRDRAVFSSVYNLPICLESICYKLPEDTPLAQEHEKIVRLAPLSSSFREALIDSRFERKPLNAKAALSHIRHKGTPVKWAYAVLEDGLFLCYPGSGEYPDNFEAKNNVWYKQGYGKYDPVWSPPYLDLDQKSRVLTCSVSIFDEEGQVLGVVSIDLDLNRAIQELLPPPQELGNKTAYLLDEKGRIIAASGFDMVILNQNIGEVFPHEKLVQAIHRKEAGLLLDSEDAESLAFAYQQIPALGWYYVEIAELDTLLIQRALDYL